MSKLELYIGLPAPDEARGAYNRARSRGGNPVLLAAAKAQMEHELSADAFAWPSEVKVCRPGTDTSRAVAAIRPTVESDELARFLAGGRLRDETVLIVTEATEGAAPYAGWTPVIVGYPPPTPSPTLSSSVGSLAGPILPAGTDASLVDGLVGADRDLAVRLKNDTTTSSWIHVPMPRAAKAADWHPLLVDDVGTILAGVWTPDDQRVRVYVVPVGRSWATILNWLILQAVPEFVPEAARRARISSALDDRLRTTSEREAIAELNRQAAEIERLEAALAGATGDADAVRDPLLFGTADDLKLAIKAVLEHCGFVVEDLDESLGTESADLLVSRAGQYWLLEAKSASGSAGEPLVDDLKRHLDTWSALGRSEAISRGVLVLNHNHRTDPMGRPPGPYRRQAFLDSLTVSVIPSVMLFHFWATRDCAGLTQAMSSPGQHPTPW